MRRLALAFVCAGLLAAAYAPAATAVTILPVSGEEVIVEWTDDGVESWHGAPLYGTPWGDVPGTVFMKRDMVLTLEMVTAPGPGHDYVAGINTSSFGFQLNLRTWHGAGSGRVRIDPAAYAPGGWFDCSFTEVYVGGFPPGWRGLDVCKGQGTLDGVQLRLHIEHDSITFHTMFTGFVFVPGS